MLYVDGQPPALKHPISSKVSSAQPAYTTCIQASLTQDGVVIYPHSRTEPVCKHPDAACINVRLQQYSAYTIIYPTEKCLKTM